MASVQLLLLTIILQLLSKSKEADVVLIDCICIYRSTRTSFNPVILYVWILNKDAPGGLAVALTRNWIFRSRVAVFIYRLFNSFSLLFFFSFRIPFLTVRLASEGLTTLCTLSMDTFLLPCPCLPTNERLYGATVTFSTLFMIVADIRHHVHDSKMFGKAAIKSLLERNSQKAV